MSHIANFHNRTLNVAVNVSPPYVFLKENGTSFITDGGSEVRLLDTLAEHFNFRYEIHNMHATWGSKNINGTWNGLMGSIIEKKCHIGLGGITLNYDRYTALPFLYPHIVSRVTFITPAPKMAPNLYLGLKPFTYDVWSAFVVALLACFIMDRLYLLVCNKSFFFISIYALFRQQYHDNPDWLKRLWMIFWIVFTFILTTVYAGNLVSLITIPIRMKTIDTIQDLLEAAQNNRIIITGLSSAYTDALKNSSLPVYKAISNYVNEVKSKREGYSLVATGRFGKKSPKINTKNRQYSFISTEESLRYGQKLWGDNHIYMTTDSDGGAFFIDLLGLPVQYGLPYKNEINNAISHLLEGGILNHWQDLEYRRLKMTTNYSLNSIKLSDQNDDSFDDFDISQLQSFFFLYLFGIVISLFTFIFEHFYFNIM